VAGDTVTGGKRDENGLDLRDRNDMRDMVSLYLAHNPLNPYKIAEMAYGAGLREQQRRQQQQRKNEVTP
jgi:hypothetical protein